MSEDQSRDSGETIKDTEKSTSRVILVGLRDSFIQSINLSYLLSGREPQENNNDLRILRKMTLGLLLV